MGDIKVTTRTFTVKEGMTPEDVKKSPYANALQKKMADVFDADGEKGYSKREAEVFNATLITDRGKDGVSLWTKFANGTKKETMVNGDLTAFKYAPKGDVKQIAYRTGKPQTKPVTKKQSAKFDYVSPKIGEDGIVSSDTIFYPGTKAPKYIMYCTSADASKKTESLKYEESFTKDGKLKDFSRIWNFNKKFNQHEYDRYNNKGEKIETNYEAEGGYMFNRREGDDGGHTVCNTDKKGRILYYDNVGYKPNYSHFESTYKYNSDGSYTEREKSYYSGNSVNEFNEYDKNDRLIRKKKLNSDDIIEYTVTPKYDKDGLVIKNDTVWNKQK